MEGKSLHTSVEHRREVGPTILLQLSWVLSLGGILGVLMSVIYYRAFGAPRAWTELMNSGVAGTWRIRSRRNWFENKTSYPEWEPVTRRRRTQGDSYQGSDVQNGFGALGVSKPIVGRSDDWPLPRKGDSRPYFDFVLVVFSGDDLDALEKRDNMREMYGTYGGEILIMDERAQAYVYTFKVLYVVGHPGAAEEGDLMDDVLYVKVEKGYRNIAAKTKKMLEAVNHIRFKYLLKADDDTFVCLRRMASQMHLVPAHIKPKVYGGIPTACHLPNNPNDFVGKVIKDETNKWYDGKYLNHTMNGLDCYPVYMQGAFYVLSYPLVEFLNQGSSKLLPFDNEDVTVGLWLHGVDRAIFPLNDLRDARLWECSCKKTGFQASVDANVFFHNCKSLDDMRACKVSMPLC